MIFRRRILGRSIAAAFSIFLVVGCATASKAPPTEKTVTTAPADPKEARLTGLEKAQVLLSEGKTEEAASRIEALSTAESAPSELKLVHAAVLVSDGKLDEARAEVGRVLSTEPTNSKANLMAAELARFDDDEKGRRAYLDTALAAAPNDGDVLAAWGLLHFDAKAWAKAEDFFRRALSVDSGNSDAALGLGRTLYRLGKYTEAEARLSIAIGLSPDEALGYADRSKVRYQLGKYAEAEADLDLAVRKSPASPWLYLDRGRLLLSLGKKLEAESDFSKSIELDPEYFLPYTYRGGIREEAGQDEEALADYRKILALYPDYWYAYESSATVAFRLGYWAEAAGAFGKAFGFAKDRYEYIIASALATWRDGRPREASAIAAKAAPTVDREKNGIYWLMLRLIQDQNDSSAELEIKIQNEKKLDAKAAILFYLGEYWLCRDRIELASKYFDLSLELDRRQSLEYRLLTSERTKLTAMGAHG